MLIPISGSSTPRRLSMTLCLSIKLLDRFHQDNMPGRYLHPTTGEKPAICTVIDVEGLWLTIGCE